MSDELPNSDGVLRQIAAFNLSGIQYASYDKQAKVVNWTSKFIECGASGGLAM
ncbi:MAG: hypothetical protein ACJAU6_002249 [Alphaproteobacteria bacterium]|jgi:hypothetical protein